MNRYTALLRRSLPWLRREGPASQPLAFTEPAGGWPIFVERQPEHDAEASSAEDAAPQLDFVARRALQAERRAAIITAFDAAHPIERRDDLAERNDTLNLLFDAVLEGRQHAIIHGPRGSGKTSLARVFGDYADQAGATVLYMACEPTQSFAALMAPYLADIPRTVLRPGASLNVLDHDLSSPRALVNLLAEAVASQVIFIFDEFDRITDPALQASIATTMKLLSDSRVTVQFILVGIAQSVDGLIAGHLSLRRHLTAVELSLLSIRGVQNIIDRGSQLSGVVFDEGARQVILRASCGSPYHVQLFCQSSGLELIRRDANAVTTDTARAGLALAVEAWGRLNRRDHMLFEALCRDAAPARARYMDLAAAAIQTGGLERAGLAPELRDATDRLSEVLTSRPEAPDRSVFLDTLAPQFLRAMLILSDEHDPANGITT